VADVGAGVIVPVKFIEGVKHVDVTVLRDAVREVLGSPRYAEGARRAGSQLRKYGGAGAAARLIEDFSSKSERG
jgi:UDP:flavonoid glycosyltransferase YjiC (YdhE family)